MLKNIILGLIRFYQRYISPMSAPRCRYYPTCSAYGRQAVLWHGTSKGTWLMIRRIGRCHPWGGSGVDFVPLPMYRWRYEYLGMAKFSYVYQDLRFYPSLLNHYLKRYP